jgi:serine/threonine-protein kinase
MAENISDESFARYINQIGNATFEQIEEARAEQARHARSGLQLSLGEVLVQQGVLTPSMRENVEKKLQAQQSDGIEQIGPYKLIKKLGEGGMGVVYLAEDMNIGRKFAVKILPERYADDGEFVSRFRREARAAGSLNHVNIVSAYNIGEDQGTHFIAMEYCEGEPLDNALKRDGSMPCEKALEIVIQIARGLGHAHEHGFIHRDIKPANIMLCKPLGDGNGPGVAKILDLGLSKDMRAIEQSFNTQTGVPMGTPHYISPEQAQGEKNIDGRTDIYSLGATLYHLITGETPFQGSSAAVIMIKHINEQLPNPQDLNENIPDGVVHIIQKMMAKEPADRYRDCKELLDDLELVINGQMPNSSAIEGEKSSVGVARVVRRAGRQRPAAQVAEQGEVHPASQSGKKNILVVALAIIMGVLLLILGLVVSGKRGYEQQAAMPAADEKRKTENTEAAHLADKKSKAEEEKFKNQSAQPEDERRKLSGDKLNAEKARLEEEQQKAANAKLKTEEEQHRQAVGLEEARLAEEAEAKRKAEDERKAKEAEEKRQAEERRIAQEAEAKRKAEDERKAKEAEEKRQAEEKRIAQEAEAKRKAEDERKAKEAGEKQQVDSRLAKPAITKSQTVKMDEKAVKAGWFDSQIRINKDERLELSAEGKWCWGTVLVAWTDPSGAGGHESLRVVDKDKEGHNFFAETLIACIGDGTPFYVGNGNKIVAPESGKLKFRMNKEKLISKVRTEGDIVISVKIIEPADEEIGSFNFNGETGSLTGKLGKAGPAAPLPLQNEYAGTIALDLGGGVKLELVLVKAGEFDMGSNNGEANEKPIHKVTISRPFYIGKYDVTVAQFQAFADAVKFQTEAERSNSGWTVKDAKWQDVPGVNWRNPGFKQEDNHPVVVVTWNDAQEFCKWAAKVAERTVRLPTEAEWEYSACGPKSLKYPWGDKWEGIMANVADNSLRRAGFNMQWGELKEDDGYPFTSPGGAYKNASWCGAFDMAGNVWQWCQDGFNDNYYGESPAVDPQGPTFGGDRVLRGGCWSVGPDYCRSAHRYKANPGRRSSSSGFRVVVESVSSRTQ